MPVHHTQAINSDDGKMTEVKMMAQDDGFLPAPSITNLKAIGCILALMGTDKHKQLTDFILRQGYIDKLVSIFNICEDLNLIQNLRDLRAILAKLIEFGSFKITKEFVKDETVFVSCIGILEYEADLLDKKSHYRAIYAHCANFKQVIPFSNPQVKPLIHRVYRLEFLRNTVLYKDAKIRELLEAVLKSKTANIVQKLLEDEAFLIDLFGIMEDGSKAVEHRHDVVFFTHQLCMMAKKTNIHIYKRLCTLGLFKLLEFAFTAESDRVKVAGIEILLMAMEKSSSLVHFHIIEQAKFKSDKGFLDPIIDLFLRNDDTELISRSSEVIRSMVKIDPYGPDENGWVHVGEHPPTSAERSSYEKRVVVLFMDVFFNQYILHVLAPVVQIKKATTEVDRATAARCANICKLLSLLVRQRFLRTKTLLSSCHLVKKIRILLRNNDKQLQMEALKFFQACLHSEDGYYYRNMIEDKAVHGVVGLLKDTNAKYNVINSACLMFFETILKMNNKALVSHCATVHKRALEEITYTPIFKDLLTLHAGNRIKTSNSNRTTNGSRDGTPGPSSKPVRGRHSRFLPGMQIPLSPSSNNQDNADARVKALLSNSIRYEQKEITVDGVGASSGVTSGVLSYGNRQRTNNFTGSGSSTSLSPLPPIASQSGVFFLEAGEDRNGGSEHVTFTDTDPELIASVTPEHVADIYSGAGPLMLEGTARASDNGVESELKLKRKRDLEPTKADGPVQQRFKPDARSTPSFRIPLFSRRSNHGNLNSSSQAFLPKLHHRKQKETGVDGVETSSDGAANGESSNGTRRNVSSSRDTLPSQPSPTLIKTNFNRDATPGNIADTISGATKLIPKDAAVASDNGAETAIKLKRKRGHESDPEPTEADGPTQQRFKLDARYISGFRIPLFSRKSNHGESSNGTSTHVNSSADTGSSPLLSPLPLVTLHSGIAFLKAGEGRDSNSEHTTIAESDTEHTTVTESDSVCVTDTDPEHVADVILGRVASAASEHVANSESDTTQLIPEVASRTGDSGAESVPMLKRKRGEDEELDPGVIDTPMQQRPKLDVTESEGVSQSVMMPQEQTLISLDNTNHSTVSNNNSLDGSNTAAVSHDSPLTDSNAIPLGSAVVVSNIRNDVLTEDIEML